MTPRRVETSLLVVEGFKDAGGTEFRSGDRVPLHHRAIRQAALERPELFAMEMEKQPVDLEWLRELDKQYEARYLEAKCGRGTAEERRQQALRDEMKEQERPDPRDLQRRYEAQEKARAKREEQARDERERRQIENELQFQSGYHYDR